MSRVPLCAKLAVVILSAWAIVGYMVFAYEPDEWNHCDAPCVVDFPEGTMEDEFQLDFTSDGLKVWKQHVDERPNPDA